MAYITTSMASSSSHNCQLRGFSIAYSSAAQRCVGATSCHTATSSPNLQPTLPAALKAWCPYLHCSNRQPASLPASLAVVYSLVHSSTSSAYLNRGPIPFASFLEAPPATYCSATPGEGLHPRCCSTCRQLSASVACTCATLGTFLSRSA